jgi:hypothetical protein
MRPDKEFLVTFRLDGVAQEQQLNCWASDPDLTPKSAKARLGFQRGFPERDHDRIQILSIKAR